MKHYAGIDVSLNSSSVCVVDESGKIIREVKVPSEPVALINCIKSLGVRVERIGLEAGPCRATCESCKSIDVRRWHREGRLRAAQQFLWTWTWDGEPSGTISARTEWDAVVLNYRAGSLLSTRLKQIEQRVPITWTNCHFGGRRPWFVCSVRANDRYCGRHVAVLYLGGEVFACRRCSGLAYASSRAACSFVTCDSHRESGRGSGPARTPVSPFPTSPAACISVRMSAFGPRRRRPKRLRLDAARISQPCDRGST
jgi:hypothetical protein